MKYVPSYIVLCWRQLILQEFFLLGVCSNTDYFFRYYSHYNGDILKFHDLLYEWVFSGRVAHNPTSEVVKQKTDLPPLLKMGATTPIWSSEYLNPGTQVLFPAQNTHWWDWRCPQSIPSACPTVNSGRKLPPTCPEAPDGAVIFHGLTPSSSHTVVSASATTSCMERPPVAVSSATGHWYAPVSLLLQLGGSPNHKCRKMVLYLKTKQVIHIFI